MVRLNYSTYTISYPFDFILKEWYISKNNERLINITIRKISVCYSNFFFIFKLLKNRILRFNSAISLHCWESFLLRLLSDSNIYPRTSLANLHCILITLNTALIFFFLYRMELYLTRTFTIDLRIFLFLRGFLFRLYLRTYIQERLSVITSKEILYGSDKFYCILVLEISILLADIFISKQKLIILIIIQYYQ